MRSPSTMVGFMDPVGTSFQSATAERNVLNPTRTTSIGLTHDRHRFDHPDFVPLRSAARFNDRTINALVRIGSSSIIPEPRCSNHPTGQFHPGVYIEPGKAQVAEVVRLRHG